jgi:hypothetical protein
LLSRSGLGFFKGRLAGVEARAQLFATDALAAFALGDAFVQAGEEPFTADGPVFSLGFEQIEGPGYDLRGLGVRAELKLALDSLFGSGVGRDDHGGIIGLEAAGWKAIQLFRLHLHSGFDPGFYGQIEVGPYRLPVAFVVVWRVVF